MSAEIDDHLPPPPPPRSKKTAASDAAPVTTGGERTRTYVWGDRILFAVAGALLGFAGAYIYLEKVPGNVPVAAVDPHAGIPGVGPGASRDLPGSGGGAPQISADPALRQKLQELEEAVQRSPNDYDLLVKLGNAAYDGDDARKAVDAYERALRIKGDDPNVLTDLGVSYRNLGDPDKALATFERALKINPKHGPAIFNEAIVYGLDKGDVGRAKAMLKRLKGDHPEMPSLDKLEKLLEERAAAGGKGS